ncbi:MAG: hypothetical protein HOK54_21540 [Alphaproteobacteria bacterium]|nr:hypothetical protein [Alphaproteobacteria bacterium]
MVGETIQRRLAAVLAADIAGYTRLMEQDTEGTVAAWHAARSDVIDPLIAAFFGRIVKHTGDGFLAEFPTAQDAVRCAVDMRDGLRESSLDFRFSVNIGDIIDDGEDIHGEGVNVAARLEGLAEPGSIYVSGEVHSLVRNRIEIEFVDKGEHEVKHVRHPVRVFAVAGTAGEMEASPTTEPAASATGSAVESDKPSIAVLPFDNLSADPDQEYFADGITEDLITTLSQIGQITVATRNAVFGFKKKAVSARDAGGQLDCRYVVTGSLRESGSRVRITAQLTDAKTEEHLWASRYDRELEDIFAIQDEITLTIATALQVTLTEGEQATLRYTTTENVTAWTHFIKGLSLFRTVSAETYRLARAAFGEALVHDPGSAQILAMLSCVHAIEGRFYWTEDRDESLRLAKEYADKALAIDPDNADGWAGLGYWHMSYLRLDESADAYATAVRLAPGHADLRALYALALTFAERPEEAVREAQAAMKLNPLDPGWYCGILGHAFCYAGRYEDAIAILLDYNRRSPGFGVVDIVLTYADMGESEKAVSFAKDLVAARPDFTIGNWVLTQNCADPARLEKDRASLEAAGLPA